jgi:hypothetical protein
MDEQGLRDSLSDHSLIHARGTYRATLVQFRTDRLNADTFDLDFTAAPIERGDPISFSLHISRDTLNDRPYLLGAIDDTIIAILDGRLKPGTRELL